MDNSAGSERRQHRRLGLHLPVRSLDCDLAMCEVRTVNVSSGGMFYVAEAAAAPLVGQELSFELAVPPGDGYWPATSRLRGKGLVVRTADCGGRVGVAVRFLQPLSIGLT